MADTVSVDEGVAASRENEELRQHRSKLRPQINSHACAAGGVW